MGTTLPKNDRLLLEGLGRRFLLLTRDQIRQLLPRTVRGTNKDLKKLLDKGYVGRRELSERLPGALQGVYYLELKGGRLLGIPAERVIRRRERAIRYSEASLPHLLSLYDVKLKWLGSGKLIRWVGSAASLWKERVHFSLRPDGYLVYVAEGVKRSAFIEIDRGTERGKAMTKKIEKYKSLLQVGRLRRAVDRIPFRILFIAATRGRAKSLAKQFPSEHFLACLHDDFLKKPLFDRYWMSRSRGDLNLMFPDIEKPTEKPSERERWPHKDDVASMPVASVSAKTTDVPVEDENEFYRDTKRALPWIQVLGLAITGLLSGLFLAVCTYMLYALARNLWSALASRLDLTILAILALTGLILTVGDSFSRKSRSRQTL